MELWSAPCAELEGGLSGPVEHPEDLKLQGPLAGVTVLAAWEALECAVQLQILCDI